MRGLQSSNRQKSRRVLNKRKSQANAIAQWVNQFQTNAPEDKLILIGDFNALQPSDRFVDLYGILIGNTDNPLTKTVEKDWIKRDLIDVTKRIPVSRRFSYRFRGNNQQLDYLFVTESLNLDLVEIRFSRIDYEISDHAALFASFQLKSN